MKKMMEWMRGWFAVRVPDSLFDKVYAGDDSMYLRMTGGVV